MMEGKIKSLSSSFFLDCHSVEPLTFEALIRVRSTEVARVRRKREMSQSESLLSISLFKACY